GPYEPQHGHRFNPHKLLLDPYARAIDRPVRYHPTLLGYDPHTPLGYTPDLRDSAPDAPRSLVIDPGFDWGADAPLRTPWTETVIYECHVKGATALHPELAQSQRGTYLGLASEPMIAHLRALGVTALELLPVHHAYHERHLIERGLINYWGYNTLGFFAPDVRFAADRRPGAQVAEFKAMVKALHAAGIEVILDVVYNHTGEADALGPSLCLRGLGNAQYYKLEANDPRHYSDFTGCGNTLDLAQPPALRLVADSLRYWVEHMRVDGFRFDLAPALARGPHGVELARGLFPLLLQDPVLSAVKLIVEPWDASMDGHRLGQFPAGFAEWNDRYRDGTRKFWRGDGGQLPELVTALAGSSQLFGHQGRTPQASINFVACHDGFTLRDLTSYSTRHNLENGWNGQDGSSHEASSNYGHEGEGASPEIRAHRERVARALLGTLAFSLGVPMLQQGDELWRTQRGNNNPYNQDNPTSWLSWALDDDARAQLAFVQRCLAERRKLAALRRTRHFDGTLVAGSTQRDVTWLEGSGRELAGADFAQPERRAFGMWLCGHDTRARPDPALPSALLLFNGGSDEQSFALPANKPGLRWQLRIDSADPARAADLGLEPRSFQLAPHSLCLLHEESAR
ncbi:MAG TPA: glycogen debranching protein GlgX, partial [Polyangiales bacterium]|nr:glycogen debranching protein GlgX [Polyangiales bacterium]